MRIAAVIPCLNEELSIARTIGAIQILNLPIDIFVVDNGSSDQTTQVASELGVVVLREPQRGKGFAVRRGFSIIPDQYEVYFMVDGDDTYDISGLPQAISLILEDGYDLVIGRRITGTSSEQRKTEFKFGHSIGNKFLSLAFRFLFRIQISDTLSGWRVMSAGYVRSFAGGASGFDIEAELNAHCHTINASVIEVPVVYQGRHEDSHSKLRTYKDGWIIFRRNFRLYRSEKPLAAYSILAFPWAFVSSILLYRVVETFQRTNLVPHFPSLIAAVGMFVVACNLWVTGMILERTRQIRVAISRATYVRRSPF